MKDSQLLKLSLTCSILGILLLLIINPQPEITNIKEITNQHLNKNIKVQATLTQIKTIDKLTILTLKDATGEITATTFQPINIEQNTKLIIEAKVTEYKETLQLQANKIITI